MLYNNKAPCAHSGLFFYCLKCKKKCEQIRDLIWLLAAWCHRSVNPFKLVASGDHKTTWWSQFCCSCGWSQMAPSPLSFNTKLNYSHDSSESNASTITGDCWLLSAGAFSLMKTVVVCCRGCLIMSVMFCVRAGDYKKDGTIWRTLIKNVVFILRPATHSKTSLYGVDRLLVVRLNWNKYHNFKRNDDFSAQAVCQQHLSTNFQNVQKHWSSKKVFYSLRQVILVTLHDVKFVKKKKNSFAEC